MISPEVILIWNGLKSNIPAGWERVTALDGKFPKAWGDEAPNITGGSNTHSHTSTAHGHVMNSHSHNVVLTHVSESPLSTDLFENLSDNHGHVSKAIAGLSGGALANTAVTWGSVNQEPPYHTVIFIKPSGGYVPIKDDMLVHWNEVAPPAGFKHCDGDNGTPDLRNKYLKGAGTDQHAGDTGGALTHQHTVTHGHTANSHTHSGPSGASDNTSQRDENGIHGAHRFHTHVISLSGVVASVNDFVKVDAGSGDTVEPDYKKIGIVQNTSGVSKVPLKGMIGMWLGALADIPLGWFVCDGSKVTPDLRNRFLKIINTTGELGDTGGNNSHQHSSVSHTHTAVGTHTHTGSTGGPSATAGRAGTGHGYATNTHTHPLASVSNATPTFQNTNIDCENVDNQPAYRTVAYIMFKYFAAGGILLSLI